MHILITFFIVSAFHFLYVDDHLCVGQVILAQVIKHLNSGSFAEDTMATQIDLPEEETQEVDDLFGDLRDPQESEVSASALVEQPSTQIATFPEQRIIDPHGDLVGTLTSARPICQKCQVEVDPYKAQIKSKGGMKYTCNICNAKCTAISRLFGRWPAEEFAELTQEELVEFWRKAKNAGTQQLRMLLVDSVVNRRVNKAEATVKGSYLPLSVYAQQGYDTELIKQHCTDVQQHPIFGLTYRVQIRGIERSTLVQDERNRVLEQTERRRDRPQLPPPAFGLPITDGVTSPPAATDGDGNGDGLGDEEKVSSDGESSSDDSSSSSTRDKKKKKKKKSKSSKKKAKKGSAKKDKQARDAAAKKEKQLQLLKDQKAMKAAAKAQASAERKLLAEATRVISKVTPVLNNLNKVMQSVHFDQIPAFAQTSIKDYHTKLLSMMQTAEDDLI
jgi:hypothetical protein